MDLKIILASFVLVFVAELGDKTQLTALAFASSSRSPWAVFIGTSLALVAAAALAVVFGEALARFLPPRVLRIGAAVLFVLIGLILLVNEARKAGGEKQPSENVSSQTGPIGAVIRQQVRAFESELAAEARDEAAATGDEALREVLLKIATAHEGHRASMLGMQGLDAPESSTTPKQREDIETHLAAVGEQSHEGSDALARLIRRQEAAAEFYIALARMTSFHDARDTLRQIAIEEIDLAQELCSLTNHPADVADA